MTDSARQEPGPRNPRLNSVNLTSVCIKLKTKCTNYEEKKREREVEIQFTPPSLFTACLRLENQDLTSQPLSRPRCPPGRVYCPALLRHHHGRIRFPTWGCGGPRPLAAVSGWMPSLSVDAETRGDPPSPLLCPLCGRSGEGGSSQQDSPAGLVGG